MLFKQVQCRFTPFFGGDMSQLEHESDAFGVSAEYWDRLDAKSQALYRSVRPLRKSAYAVDVQLSRIEGFLSDMEAQAKSMGGTFELNPDFQRGHVWDQGKQVAFVENVFRGIAPMVFRFNSPGWNRVPDATDMHPYDVVCVDGLQRLTALRAFVAGEFPIFDTYSAKDLVGTPFDTNRIGKTWRLEMFDIAKRSDLLQFYLDINSGGVVHTDAELDRVRKLRDDAVAAPAHPVAPASKAKAPKPGKSA